MAISNLEKLRGLLQELFQLDQADLDFGIYRIMNQKRDEIVRFLDKDLLPQVEEAFKQYKSADKAVLQQELDRLMATVRDAGMNPDESPKVKVLKEKIAESAVDVKALESEVFSHLFNFFRRYYDEGDFISLRRYKEGVYAIPYEGEEVKLHWANADQYYVKSSEYFHDYVFTIPSGKRVRAHLVAASSEQDNNKAESGKERRFFLCKKKPVYEESGELYIRFEYRTTEGNEKQDELNKQAIDTVLKTPGFEEWSAELGKLAATEKNPNRTVLEKHLKQYTAKNTFDYFIHKDLGGFLRRELDFYIKNEVLHLDDIEHESAPKVEQYLSQIKVFRSIANKVIEFLAQLEDFQKKLWLKKKFVIETNYCVTLDRVPQELYSEIISNDAQREWWVRQLAIDRLPDYSNPLSIGFLLKQPHLILDTAFFTSSFRDRLLKQERQLEEIAPSLLIEGDSFHCLSLLGPSLAETVHCIYIDPPYNTGNDGFIYKDSFQHSTWASFLFDRLTVTRRLMADTGILFSSVNEIERTLLDMVLSEVFGRSNRVEELIWVQDTVRNNSPTYSTNHEYIEAYARSLANVEGRRDMFREPKAGYDEVMAIVEEKERTFATIDEAEVALKELMQQHRRGHLEEQHQLGIGPKEAKRTDPWKGLYPYKFAEYRTSDGQYVPEEKAKKLNAKLRVYREVDPSMPSGKQSATTRDEAHDNFRFYKVPHPETGTLCVHPKRGWAFPQRAIGKRPSFESYVADNRIVFKDDPSMPPQIKYFLHEVSDIVSTSVVRQYSDGEQELDAMFGRKGVFPNPKPVNLIKRFVGQTCSSTATVLDFLAGSVTTAHSVLRGNREEVKHRRFILCEMGSYFDTVTKPRIAKAMYATSWEKGLPICGTGQSSGFKYIRLETYEDALGNLELRRTDKQQRLLDDDVQLREQYVLSYMLDVESRGSQSLLNIESFRHPDRYKLKVERDGETQLVNVDLVETFNWLLGLTVKHIDVIRGVRVVDGTNPAGERVLVLWRDLDEMDNEALDKWFEKQDYNTREMVYDLFYVNGDNNLENLRRTDQTWKVRLIEEEFHRLMFDVEDV